eukprot:sb/3471203/
MTGFSPSSTFTSSLSCSTGATFLHCRNGGGIIMGNICYSTSIGGAKVGFFEVVTPQNYALSGDTRIFAKKLEQVGAVTRKYDAARQKEGDNFKKSDFSRKWHQADLARGNVNTFSYLGLNAIPNERGTTGSYPVLEAVELDVKLVLSFWIWEGSLLHDVIVHSHPIHLRTSHGHLVVADLGSGEVKYS